MASYLDKTGLTTLWSKMKSHVSSNYLSLQGGAVTGNISATSYSGSWSGNTIPISKGGTGATTRVGGFNNLFFMGTNPITTTTNDTTAKWAAQGNGLAWYNTTGQLNDQPSQYGALLNMHTIGSEIAQLWFEAPNGKIYHRGGDGNNWTGTWIQLYDKVYKPTPAEIGAAAASHTHSYLPLSGGTLTGPLTASTVNVQNTSHAPLTVSRSGSTYYASIRFANSLGTLGYIGMTAVNGSLVRLCTNTAENYKIPEVRGWDGSTLTLGTT